MLAIQILSNLVNHFEEKGDTSSLISKYINVYYRMVQWESYGEEEKFAWKIDYLNKYGYQIGVADLVINMEQMYGVIKLVTSFLNGIAKKTRNQMRLEAMLEYHLLNFFYAPKSFFCIDFEVYQNLANVLSEEEIPSALMKELYETTSLVSNGIRVFNEFLKTQKDMEM
jgi:hypothetical protein